MNKLGESLSDKDFRVVADVVKTLLVSEARSATKYMSEKLTIRASLRLLDKKLPPKNYSSIDIVLTIGAPNHEARQFIKLCKKAGETFPIQKIQLRFPPKPRKVSGTNQHK